MKYSIFLLPALLSSSVLAVGPTIFSHKFSRDSIEKWRTYLAKDSKLDAYYKSKRERQPGLWQYRCPESLKDADIQLYSAWGDYENGSDDPAQRITVDTGKLNAITFIFHVNNGECGKITVSTDQKKNLFGSSIYAWKEPEYTSTHAGNSPVIKHEEIKLSAGNAYKLAAEKFPMLKGGFRGMALGRWRERGLHGEVLQYFFRGIAQAEDEITTIHVSVADSKVWKAPLTEGEAADLGLDDTRVD